MNKLINYIHPFDCHVHLFGKEGIFEYPKPVGGMICMIENRLEFLDRKLEDYFEKYINKIPDHYKKLAVGNTKEELSSILSRWNFDGIGEIKCYKKYLYKDKQKEYYDTSILIEALKYDLPIFIHWDLGSTKDNHLIQIIKNNPTKNFILCHCGISQYNDPKEVFREACNLQMIFNNLWLSISWTALDYLCENPLELPKVMIPNRIIVGTDFNGQMDEYDVDFNDRYNKFLNIYNKFNVRSNVNNLFSKSSI